MDGRENRKCMICGAPIPYLRRMGTKTCSASCGAIYSRTYLKVRRAKIKRTLQAYAGSLATCACCGRSTTTFSYHAVRYVDDLPNVCHAIIHLCRSCSIRIKQGTESLEVLLSKLRNEGREIPPYINEKKRWLVIEKVNDENLLKSLGLGGTATVHEKDMAKKLKLSKAQSRLLALKYSIALRTSKTAAQLLLHSGLTSDEMKHPEAHIRNLMSSAQPPQQEQKQGNLIIKESLLSPADAQREPALHEKRYEEMTPEEIAQEYPGMPLEPIPIDQVPSGDKQKYIFGNESGLAYPIKDKFRRWD